MPPPEVSQHPEQNHLGIETVEFGQPLEREFSIRHRPLAQTIVLYDRKCVIVVGGFAGSRIQEKRKLLQHDRAAGVGSPVARSETPDRCLSVRQTGDSRFEVQIGYYSDGGIIADSVNMNIFAGKLAGEHADVLETDGRLDR